MSTLTGVIRYFSTANETGSLSLTSTTSGGAATTPVTNLASYYSNGDQVSLVVEPGTANQQVVNGEVSGASLINCKWTEGSNVSHAGGSSIIDYWTATHQASLVKGLLVEHDQDGTHGDITPDSVTSAGAVTGTTVTGSGLVSGAGITSTNTTNKYDDESGNSVDTDPIRRNENFQGFDFVATGLVSTTSSGLTAAISAGTYYIAGKRYTYAGGTKLLTASKDSYLDINTSGVITEVTATIGAASPALTDNSIRIAKVLTAGASITSHNTGTVLTTAFDSLGNRIRRTDPHSKIIGIAQITSPPTATTITAVTGLKPTVIIPTWAPYVLVRLNGKSFGNDTNATGAEVSIWSTAVTSGTQLHSQVTSVSTANQQYPLAMEIPYSGSGSTVFNVGLARVSGGTATINAGATNPITLLITLP